MVVSVQAQNQGDLSTGPWRSRTVFHQKLKEAPRSVPHFNGTDPFVEFDLSRRNLLVRGDTNLSFFNDLEKMCCVSFHTAFVEDNYLW